MKMRLPLASIIALAVNTVQATTDDASLHHDVVEWLRNHGGYFNEKQTFRKENGYFGVFATEHIAEGEVLTTVPWDLVVTANKNNPRPDMHCETSRLLTLEMERGNESFYGPYVEYLNAAPPVIIPTEWSDEGKQLLEKVLGRHLPPHSFEQSMKEYWEEECGGTPDSLEIQAALLLDTRGDDDTLTPVYDMYNHRNGKYFNGDSTQFKGVMHQVRASQDINAGEQIYLSYYFCNNCFNRFYNYGTPELFRDYGFVEQYPQRWVFHTQEFGFDIDQGEDGQLQVTWLDGNFDPEFERMYSVTNKSIKFLSSELQRLEDVYKKELEPLLKSSDTIVEHELDSIMQYHNALTTAMKVAIEAERKVNKVDDYVVKEEANDMTGSAIEDDDEEDDYDYDDDEEEEEEEEIGYANGKKADHEYDNADNDGKVENNVTAANDTSSGGFEEEEKDVDDEKGFDSDSCQAEMAVNGKW